MFIEALLVPGRYNVCACRYLHCVEPKCRVWAWISLKIHKAPLVMADDRVQHNHAPDFERRKRLLLEHRVMQKALLSKDLPLEDIWRAEAAK